MSGLLAGSRRLARGLAGRVRRGGIRRLHGAVARLPIPERTSGGIPTKLLAAKRLELARKRTFGPADLAALAALLDRADAVLPLRDCLDPARSRPARLIGLRHDTDHDIEHSVRMAEWEAARGYRSTYFVLHGDWYWGGPTATGPSRFVLRALDRIASLGHEIGLHNNAVTLALLTGEDPFRILERDLVALRRHGFEISGSVRHGDRLCREIGYVNSELFTECPRPVYEPLDRPLVHQDPASGLRRELRLRARSMAEFGLAYEANWIGHSLYQTDTGGHWGAPFDEIEGRFAEAGGFLQILVHPVWWAMAGEPIRARPAVSVASPGT